MKRYGLIAVLVIIGYSLPTFGQEAKFKLYGERDEDIIRLAWIPQFWPEELEGMVVKRKTVNSAWQLVTSRPVIPASYPAKDLSNIETSVSERQRLSNKLDSMIAHGKAKPVYEQEYFENILQNSTSLSGIAFIFALDYDLILLNGFGCVDRNIEPNTIYSYGLFSVISGNESKIPLATFDMATSDKANLNLAMDAHVEVIGNNKKLRLHWRFDLKEYRKRDIKGFNIHRKINGMQTTKLNDHVIWITSKEDPADLNLLVDFPESNVQYHALPISYFGLEGKGHKIEFHPAAYTIAIPAPKLNYSINNDQVNITWQIDHGYDSLIKQFTILKKSDTNDYLKITSLDSNTRSYKAELNVNGDQSRYKIIAATITGREIWSNEAVLSYVPVTKPPVPQNLTGMLVLKEGSYFIELKWDYPETSTKVEFRIFADGPNGELIFDSSLPKGIQSPYEIEVKKSKSQLYHYAVQARAPDRSTSILSNEIEILGPSKYLPPISISKISNGADEIKVEWKFANDIADLYGFRILLDGAVFIHEQNIDKSAREVTLKNITTGRHIISIVAITIFGIESMPSIPKNLFIP